MSTKSHESSMSLALQIRKHWMKYANQVGSDHWFFDCALKKYPLLLILQKREISSWDCHTQRDRTSKSSSRGYQTKVKKSLFHQWYRYLLLLGSSRYWSAEKPASIWSSITTNSRTSTWYALFHDLNFCSSSFVSIQIIRFWNHIVTPPQNQLLNRSMTCIRMQSIQSKPGKVGHRCDKRQKQSKSDIYILLDLTWQLVQNFEEPPWAFEHVDWRS